MKVPGWGGSEHHELSLKSEFGYEYFQLIELATFLFFLLNLTLVCEHSLHRWGKERGFQQLGPGLHLVAGGISRLVCWEIARVSNVVDGLGPGRSGSVAVFPTVPGVMSGIGSAALETAVVVLQV